MLILVEQQRILNESSSLQKQEYSNLDNLYRQIQGALKQAQNERKSVSSTFHRVLGRVVADMDRRWSRLQVNKLRSIDCAVNLPFYVPRRSNGRYVKAITMPGTSRLTWL